MNAQDEENQLEAADAVVDRDIDFDKDIEIDFDKTYSQYERFNGRF